MFYSTLGGRTKKIREKKNGRKYDKYGFISTGNFNESTAKVYTDITLFTANKEILDDVSSIFDFIEINYKKIKFKKIENM